MEEKQKNLDPIMLDIKDLARIFKKQKWWFIGSFIIIFIISFLVLFNLNNNSQYGYKSQLSISTKNIEMQTFIASVYPEESDKLWLISTNKWWIMSTYLDVMRNEIRSKDTLKDLKDYLKLEESVEEISKLVRLDVVTGEQTKLLLTTYNKNLDLAKKLNDSLLKVYLDNKNEEFEKTYNELLTKVNSQISVKEKEFNQLSLEAENYYYESNKKILSEVISEVGDGNVINFTSSNFIPPELQNKINVSSGELNSLNSIKKDLFDKRDEYINRIVVEEISDTEQNSFMLRDLLVSIFAALLFGLIMVYFVNFIISLRKK